MEESPSTTPSDDEALRLMKEAYDLAVENWKVNAAVCVILLEQAGGMAEFTPEQLEAVDLNRANVTVTHDEERNMYVIEGSYDEPES